MADYLFQLPICWHAFSSTFNADAVRRVYVVGMITMDYAGVASAARRNSTRALFKEIVSRCVAMSSNVVYALRVYCGRNHFSVFALQSRLIRIIRGKRGSRKVLSYLLFYQNS